MGIPGGRGRAVVAALLVAAVAVVVGYRVLAPAEVSSAARSPYPDAVTPQPRVIGRLSAAPLIVDRRLRVYAAQRQVWADQPIDARTRRTPYWSYRRWPAQLSGVVALRGTVVTRWSDGQLVALNADTGQVAWRATGPVPGQGYTGRRTGAATVYTPSGLRTAVGPGGRALVIVVGDAALAGFDLSDGRRAWQAAVRRGCRTDAVTTTTARLVTVDTCATPPVAEFRDVATGAVLDRWRPPGADATLTVGAVGCAAGRSQCRGLRTGGDGVDRGWLVGDAGPVAAPALDPAGSVLAGDVAVSRADDGLEARSVRTGAVLWHRVEPADTRILAVQPGRIHLLTASHDLVTLDAATGTERSRLPLTVGRDSLDWAPGLAYAADGFVAVERLREPVDPAADDHGYYRMAEPVVLAET